MFNERGNLMAGYDYEWFKNKIYNFIGINLSFYKERQMKRRFHAFPNLKYRKRWKKI